MLKDLLISLVVGTLVIALLFWVSFGSHIAEEFGNDGGDAEIHLIVTVEDDYGEKIEGARATLSTIAGKQAEGVTNKDGAVRLRADAPPEAVILNVAHGDREIELYGAEIWQRAQRRLSSQYLTVTLRRGAPPD